MKSMSVLSLGWGVQSFTLAAMSALGEIEHADVLLHSDTLHESRLTYEYAAQMTTWLEAHEMRVVTVKNPTGGFWEVVKRPGQTHVPAFTLSPLGKSGQLRRSCTHRWKIVPMRRWLQAHRDGAQIKQWIGISTDEFMRMKPSDVKYITHRWPLIELGMSRNDCINWLTSHRIEVPSRSACTFCPYHSAIEWRRIQQIPDDWQEAVTVDRKLRKLRPPYDLFLHPARIPLEEIDFRSQEEHGQMRMWDDECSGICGL